MLYLIKIGDLKSQVKMFRDQLHNSVTQGVQKLINIVRDKNTVHGLSHSALCYVTVSYNVHSTVLKISLFNFQLCL